MGELGKTLRKMLCSMWSVKISIVSPLKDSTGELWGQPLPSETADLSYMKYQYPSAVRHCLAKPTSPRSQPLSPQSLWRCRCKCISWSKNADNSISQTHNQHRIPIFQWHIPKQLKSVIQLLFLFFIFYLIDGITTRSCICTWNWIELQHSI